KSLAPLLKHPDVLIHYRLEGKLKTGMEFRHTVRIGKTGDVAPEELIQRKCSRGLSTQIALDQLQQKLPDIRCPQRPID
ncbi:hypothetical protein RA262_29075, partial [Pseudomonas syringae pv. tagetis]